MLRRHLIQGAASLGLVGLGGNRNVFAAPANTAGAPPPYQWSSVPFGGGGFVNGFAFHPREQGLLYARTETGGLYRFDTKTQAWVALFDGLSADDGDLMNVLSLALDPDDPERVYAACGMTTSKDWGRKAALLASANRGQTWAVHELDFKLGAVENGRGTGERLQVDPHQSSVLLLGTSINGLWRSADRGKSFQALDFAPRHVSLVLFDPDSAAPNAGCRTIWAGSHDQPGLYVSRDSGRSFEREPGPPAQIPQRAVIARDRTLYVTFALGASGQPTNPGNASTGSVWKRDRNGRWTDITPMKPNPSTATFGYSGIDVDRRVPGRVLVSTMERWSMGDELFVSDDSGATWQPMSNQSRHDTKPYPWLAEYLRGVDRMGHWLADLKIDPFNSDHVIYGTGYGVWSANNLGAAQKSELLLWKFSVAGMDLESANEIRSPSGGVNLLAAVYAYGGSAWDHIDATPSRQGMFTPVSETCRSIDFAYARPAIIARTTDGDTGGYVSLNGGSSWRPFGAPPRPAGTQAATGGPVAVSAQGGFMVWVPAQRGAMFSADQGRSWEPCVGLPDAANNSLVPVADRTLEGVFYVHDRARGQIMQSIDGGRKFEPSIVGVPEVQNWQGSQLVCAPGVVRDLWLALPDGLVHLPGVGLPPKTIAAIVEARMIALGKAAPGARYHALYVWGKLQRNSTEINGLFRSDDMGASFTRIDDDQHRYGRLLSMTADPLEHGVLYLAPNGHGIVVGRPRLSN
jgi:photosystem II stability/assembly factor-like uncharacterized protein